MESEEKNDREIVTRKLGENQLTYCHDWYWIPKRETGSFHFWEYGWDDFFE